MPVVYTDFTSQYPTVNALLGNWNVLKASAVRFEPCTPQVRTMLSKLTAADTFKPRFWRELSFFALVKPESDIFPVRTVYAGGTQNIGVNQLSSENGVWYAGPDLVASKLLNRDKVPRITKAVRMVSRGEQANLIPTNLGGMVAVDPRKDDFFVKIIQQRIHFKPKDKSLAKFLKVVANSGSYGLFVQVDPETKTKAVDVGVFSGEQKLRISSRYVEKLGPWYFPPVASLITSGGRLLLAMLERSIQDLEGNYLFCDTDSMCIVASELGGLTPCVGGPFELHDQGAIKALSFAQVAKMAERFNELNPYGSVVRAILKTEDINHVDSDTSKPRRQLFEYSISSKRYALYTQIGDTISIVKASGHGLGYLLSPKEEKEEKKPTDVADDEEDDDDDKVPEWVNEAWERLLCKELGLPSKDPDWLDLPAMMRMAMTSPNVMRTGRPEWLTAFNFFLLPLLAEDGYPVGFDSSNFKFITPAERARRKWPTLKGINLLDGQTYRIRMTPDGNQRDPVPDSMRIILRQYLDHPEAKSLASDGTPCTGKTVGLLHRVSIVAAKVIPIGKETDRHWEQGENMSLVDFTVKELRPPAKMVTAEPGDRERWKAIGVRRLIRQSQLHQKTVYAILQGRSVRKQTLAIFKRAIDR